MRLGMFWIKRKPHDNNPPPSHPHPSRAPSKTMSARRPWLYTLECPSANQIQACNRIIMRYKAYTVPSKKYWNSKDKIALLAVESRHLQIWLKDEYEAKLQNVTFYYWVIQHVDVLPAKKISTLSFIPLSDVSISIGTVASQVFLSDQLCPV